MKCVDCRKSDAQETTWEKLAHWIIWRFPEAVKAERISASLHSFEDGFRIGCKHTQENCDAQKLNANQLLDKQVQDRLCQVNYLVNPAHIFQVSPTGIAYLGLEPVSKQKAKELKSEAKLIQGTDLWDILQHTLRQKAIDMGMKNSTTWEHVLPAKMTVYSLDIIKSVVDSCAKIDVDRVLDGGVSIPFTQVK
jgi:hypothetical protein